MNNAQFVTALREQIANAQRQGITGISFVDLDAHLVNMADWSAREEGYETRAHEHALEVYRQNTLTYLELFKSIIEYGKEALKAAMLINGAAAGAMLAFLGSVSGQAARGAARASLVGGGTWFAYGVLTIAFGGGRESFWPSCPASRSTRLSGSRPASPPHLCLPRWRLLTVRRSSLASDGRPFARQHPDA